MVGWADWEWPDGGSAKSRQKALADGGAISRAMYGCARALVLLVRPVHRCARAARTQVRRCTGAVLRVRAAAGMVGWADWEWPDGDSAKSRQKERGVSSAVP